MNKKLTFPLLAIILLACSITSPLATTTPTAQTDSDPTILPQPTEITPSAISTATSEISVTSVVDTATPTCDQLNLTPEECATFGTHQYNLHGVLTGDCRYKGGNSKEETITLTFSFTENKLTEPEGKRWNCRELTKTDKNSFAVDCNFPATDYSTDAGFSMTRNISFNDAGFVETKKQTWVDKVSGQTMICDWTETYELIK